MNFPNFATITAFLAVGCSQTPLHTDEGSPDAPRSLSEAVAPVPVSPSDMPPQEQDVKGVGPFELLWAEKLFAGAQSGREPIFVTCHAAPGDIAYLIRLYGCRDGRINLEGECRFGWGYLENREVFIDGNDAFLLMTHNSGGSAASWQSQVFWLGEVYGEEPRRIGIREVTIESPLGALRHLLGRGQHSDPHRVSVGSDANRSLRFSFCIWNEGEPNNFPTGGSVEGDLKLVRDEDGIPTAFVVGD